jgi:hypothetical protein
MESSFDRCAMKSPASRSRTKAFIDGRALEPEVCELLCERELGNGDWGLIERAALSATSALSISKPIHRQRTRGKGRRPRLAPFLFGLREGYDQSWALGGAMRDNRINVDVRDDSIIVTIPGSSFRTAFFKSPKRAKDLPIFTHPSRQRMAPYP